MSEGICSDTSGNVWILDYDTGYAYEYAHGATSPETTLVDADSPLDCSAEASTGNLAVSSYGAIAVFPHASGSPTYYGTRGILEG